MALRRRTRRARKLRRDATDAEGVLWRALREANLPFRVRRQHPVGRYVVDFAIPGRKLAIEIDGGQHATETSGDDARTEALAARGYRVIRFWNNEVLGNIEGVMRAIAAETERTPTSP
jgi:very-short-patch-repair endonuclease